MNGIFRLAYWRGRLRDFGPAQGGNIAITFAAFSFPMIFFMGWAIDYSVATSARASMQAALDATGLTLSREALTLTEQQLKDKSLTYFLANFNRADAKNVIITPTYTDLNNGKYKLALAAAAQVPTSLTGIWQDHINIGAETQVIWGYRKLELALALDNTGSMSSSGKMNQLKIAAKNLLTTLKTAAKKDGDVKISIVPFSTAVNVGTGNVGASWIRWDLWESDNANYYCSKSQYSSKNSCTSNGGQWLLKARSTWNGCIFDRNQNHDVANTTPNQAVNATLFPANQATNCPVAMMPLSYSWTALNDKIDAMTPTGNTNVTIGLALALQTLSPVSPFNASATSSDLDKAIILLTDGDNTQNRFSTNKNTIDARTRLACTNAKAANIKVYTIRVINGNASLLRDCATKPEMYFDVQDASQLNTVFTTIANSLASLRLAQ